MYEESFNMARREILPMNMHLLQTTITTHDKRIQVLPDVPNWNSDVFISECPSAKVVPYEPQLRFKIRD